VSNLCQAFSQERLRGGIVVYEPIQEILVGELRLRGMMQVAEIMRILRSGLASLIPYEIQRMKEIGLVIYEEPLGPDSVLRLPQT
jgi:hypothetical protein